MSLMSNVSRVYLCCEGLKLVAEQHDHPLFHQLVGEIESLRFVIQNRNLDPNDEWNRLLRGLRRYRYFVESAPIPFSGLSVLGRLSLDEVERLLMVGRDSEPGFADLAARVFRTYRELEQRAEASPLLGPTADLSRNPGSIVVMNDRQLVKLVEAHLPDRKVTHSSALARHETFDRIILVGDIRRYPDWLLSSPRAIEIVNIAYQWQSVTWEPTTQLVGTVQGSQVTLLERPNPQRPMVLREPLDEVFDVQAFSAVMREETIRAGVSDYELVPARLYRLTGDRGVYLPIEEKAMVVDPDALGKDRLRRLQDEAIEVGMFVVLRTGRSRDAVKEIADGILGDHAAPLRDGQRRWKQTLRNQLVHDGIEETCRKLRHQGVSTASPWNLRNWVSDLVIAPGNPSEFREVLKLIGMEAEFEVLWSGVARIRSARRQAGRIIMRSLLNQLQHVDPEKLMDDGEELFELEEYPNVQLGAYQIVWRSPELEQVHESELGRVVVLEGM